MDEAWALGGLILVDHLGMLEDALEWWSNYRDVNPESPVPLIEQASILARYGDYDKASQVSDQILLLEGHRCPLHKAGGWRTSEEVCMMQ